MGDALKPSPRFSASPVAGYSRALLGRTAASDWAARRGGAPCNFYSGCPPATLCRGTPERSRVPAAFAPGVMQCGCLTTRLASDFHSHRPWLHQRVRKAQKRETKGARSRQVAAGPRACPHARSTRLFLLVSFRAWPWLADTVTRLHTLVFSPLLDLEPFAVHPPPPLPYTSILLRLPTTVRLSGPGISLFILCDSFLLLYLLFPYEHATASLEQVFISSYRPDSPTNDRPPYHIA